MRRQERQAGGVSQLSTFAKLAITAISGCALDLQLVIKALPPAKTKPVTNQLVAKGGEETVTVQAPAQAIHMIQQAAIKASAQQRVTVQMASPNLINAQPASSQPGIVRPAVPEFLARASSLVM